MSDFLHLTAIGLLGDDLLRGPVTGAVLDGIGNAMNSRHAEEKLIGRRNFGAGTERRGSR